MTLSPVATLPLLALTEPLPGFPGYRDYVLVTADGDGRFFWLQSMAAEGPRFLALDPARYFPGYDPDLPEATRRELGLDGCRPRLFCLVTVPSGGPAAATANLRAPLVVNPSTWQAAQVVLPDAGLPIRHHLRR